MGFEPVTSAMPVQCSANWAVKPTGSWSHCKFIIYPRRMNKWIWLYGTYILTAGEIFLFVFCFVLLLLLLLLLFFFFFFFFFKKKKKWNTLLLSNVRRYISGPSLQPVYKKIWTAQGANQNAPFHRSPVQLYNKSLYLNVNVFSCQSTNWGHSPDWFGTEFGNVGFWREGKTRVPKENLLD